MTDSSKTQKLEDIECPQLNDLWIRQNQHTMKAMGANPAELTSPGLKVQVLRAKDYGIKRVYCDSCKIEDNSCDITGKRCTYLQ